MAQIRKWAGNSIEGVDVPFTTKDTTITYDYVSDPSNPRLLFTQVAGSTMLAQWQALGGLTSHAGRFVIDVVGATAGTSSTDFYCPVQVGGAAALSLAITNESHASGARKLRIKNSANTSLGSTTTTLAPGMRVEWVANATTIEVKIFPSIYSTTATETLGFTNTFGAVDSARWGNPLTTTTLAPTAISNLRLDNTNAYIGPPPVQPTAWNVDNISLEEDAPDPGGVWLVNNIRLGDLPSFSWDVNNIQLTDTSPTGVTYWDVNNISLVADAAGIPPTIFAFDGTTIRPVEMYVTLNGTSWTFVAR